jgi:hypothetical protein
MVSINITMKQPSNVVNFYRKKGYFKEALNETYYDLGQQAISDMQQRIDQQTSISGSGARSLKDSLAYEVDEENQRLSVKSDAPHAAAMEFGATFTRYPHSESLKKWAEMAGIPYNVLQHTLKQKGLKPIGYLRHAQHQMIQNFTKVFFGHIKRLSKTK